jgi:tetratricopeptide (TPR) repeat protein
LRNLASARQSDTAQVLRESATTAEYFAASLKGTQHERLATGLCIYQWANADLREAPLAYADFSNGGRKMSDSDEMQAYTGLGDWLLEHGDYQRAIKSLNEVIAKHPMDANAFINRSFAKIQLGDLQGAILDCTSVIEMEGVPKDEVARALVKRGAAKGMLNETQEAISDYTSVVEMEDAPKEEVASALVNRGVAKGRSGNVRRAIADYTAVIEMMGVSNEGISRALFNRGLTFLQLDEALAAIADWIKVIDLRIITDNLAVDAAIAAYRVLWARNDYFGAKAVVVKLGGVVNSSSKEFASATAIRFLSCIISPTMKDGWPAAWRILAETQRTEVAETLQFLKPVCAVLEGKDRAVLDGLPPEQREFAKNVLRSFDAEPR